MKKLLATIAALSALVASISFTSCSDDDETTWDKYAEWREVNEQWLKEMQAKTDTNGKPYYDIVIPSWQPGSFVLMHYYNDPQENADKLSPLYNSTVDVRYKLHLYDGTAVDSSDNITSYGAKGIYRTRLTQVVTGWAIAVQNMHCGDSVEVIIPYEVGYGEQEYDPIYPYSNLVFNIRLVDIPYYEATPYEN